MNAYKVTMKEEVAIRQWQNAISFGTANCSEPEINVQQNQKPVAFEVLP